MTGDDTLTKSGGNSVPANSDPEAVFQELDRVGVDTSLTHAEIIDFLGNPDFTPYPAIAEALLKLLSAGLRRPVFMDVIVGNYENSPGNPSPRRLEDVDFHLLQMSVLDGSNTRYAEEVQDFTALLRH
jgi:hypothetical protein